MQSPNHHSIAPAQPFKTKKALPCSETLNLLTQKSIPPPQIKPPQQLPPLTTAEPWQVDRALIVERGKSLEGADDLWGADWVFGVGVALWEIGNLASTLRAKPHLLTVEWVAEALWATTARSTDLLSANLLTKPNPYRKTKSSRTWQPLLTATQCLPPATNRSTISPNKKRAPK